MNNTNAVWAPKLFFWVSLGIFVALTIVAEALRENFSWVRLALNIALTPLFAGAVWFIARLVQKGRKKPPSGTA